MKSARAGMKALAVLVVTAGALASSQAATPDLQAQHAQALDQAAQGNVKAAIRTLESALKRTKANRKELDRASLSLGRLRYEIGDYAGAIASYDKVEKGGASWLEALEEEAWAEFRRDRPQDAIARLKTVTSPTFKDKVRSEPFFLLGLAQLRVCDFKAIFKTIETFKTRFVEKTKELEKSAARADVAKLKEIGETVQKLNIVEAEAIQRLYLDENGKPRKGSPPSVARGADQLSFPTDGDDEEVWMDEIDSYRVTLKGCLPANVSAESSGASSGATVAKQETK